MIVSSGLTVPVAVTAREIGPTVTGIAHIADRGTRAQTPPGDNDSEQKRKHRARDEHPMVSCSARRCRSGQGKRKCHQLRSFIAAR